MIEASNCQSNAAQFCSIIFLLTWHHSCTLPVDQLLAFSLQLLLHLWWLRIGHENCTSSMAWNWPFNDKVEVTSKHKA